MKLLLCLDRGDYTNDLSIYERFAVRAIIERDGLLAMQRGNAGDYKLPGGMMDADETTADTLLREVQEETGLLVVPESIREWGEVVEHRRDLRNPSQQYICHSLCYYCAVRDHSVPAQPTPSELLRGYQLTWAALPDILAANHALVSPDLWIARDTAIVELLQTETNRLPKR